MSLTEQLADIDSPTAKNRCGDSLYSTTFLNYCTM